MSTPSATPRSFRETIGSGCIVLTDGGIETRIMFGELGADVVLDPVLGAAPLVDDAVGGPALRSIYAGYLDATRPSGLPVIIGTPTFRAGPRWVRDAGRPDADVASLNAAAARAHHRLRDDVGDETVFIAGVLGPAGDAYTPSDGLAAADAANYHRPQAEALAAAAVDLLFAATFPSVEEAVGCSRAMGATGRDHVVSFVLGPDGRVLDGTPLHAAIERIDAEVPVPPLYYSLSCVHPSLAARALGNEAAVSDLVSQRLRECKANGSALPTSELVLLDHPTADPPDRFAEEMWQLHTDQGLTVLGGCCGTDERHIAALARIATAPPS